jgi:hypothetical protein
VPPGLAPAKVPAPAKDEQDNSATQAIHVDVADGHSGN